MGHVDRRLHDLERRFKVMSPEVLERVVSRKVLSRLSDEELVVCEQIMKLPVEEEFSGKQKDFLDRHAGLLEEVRSEHRLE